jgi:hypothetical protein
VRLDASPDERLEHVRPLSDEARGFRHTAADLRRLLGALEETTPGTDARRDPTAVG